MLKALALKSEQNTPMTSFTPHCTGVPNQYSKKVKQEKIQKEYNKLEKISLFFFIMNPIRSPCELLALTFSQVAEYHVTKKVHCVSVY